MYMCMRARCFHARVWKKSGPARGGGRGREDVDIFLRATRECRERHAFDWPRGEEGERVRAGKAVGVAAVVQNPGGEDERRGRLGGRGGGAEDVAEGGAGVVHPLPSIFRGFFLRATALACLDERTRGGTSIIYNQTADKATIALL